MRICSVQSHNVLVFHAGLCCLGSLVDRSLPRVGVLALTCALCFMFPLFVSKLQGPFGWELKTSLFAWRTFKLTRPRPPRVWITIPFADLVIKVWPIVAGVFLAETIWFCCKKASVKPSMATNYRSISWVPKTGSFFREVIFWVKLPWTLHVVF